MKIWQKTDQGAVRKENQDICAAEQLDQYTLAVVCDGMGGARAGALASSLAAGAFLEALRGMLRPGQDITAVAQAGEAAVAKANHIVYERSREDKECRGMGTTLVAAVCAGPQATIFNVGDSRAYRINESGICAVTRDHSVVQDMLENGDITEEEARRHPNRNLITRALGTEREVLCDVFQLSLSKDDSLLLCSDGLVNTVSDQEMLYEVIHGEPRNTCLDRLMEIAIDRGAPDNVTMILMQYEEEADG